MAGSITPNVGNSQAVHVGASRQTGFCKVSGFSDFAKSLTYPFSVPPGPFDSSLATIFDAHRTFV